MDDRQASNGLLVDGATLQDISGPRLAAVKDAIMTALSHPEAEDGLYFRNFFHLHEEDQRPVVEAQEDELFEALRALIGEGVVSMRGSGTDVVFSRRI